MTLSAIPKFIFIQYSFVFNKNMLIYFPKETRIIYGLSISFLSIAELLLLQLSQIICLYQWQWEISTGNWKNCDSQVGFSVKFSMIAFSEEYSSVRLSDAYLRQKK